MTDYFDSLLWGIALGLAHGAIFLLIGNQVTSIYSQAAFRYYYDPAMVAFIGASVCSVGGLLIVLTSGIWFRYFMMLGNKLREIQERHAQERP